MKTLGQFLEEAKATYCGRCGTRHVPPAKGGTCPALKEEVDYDRHFSRQSQAVQTKINHHLRQGADYPTAARKAGATAIRVGKLKEGHVPTADEPTEHDKKMAQKVRDLLAKEKKPKKMDEAAQIDELSKKTLGNYAYKAATDIGQHGITAGLKVADNEPTQKHFKKMGNRQKGIATAVKKLTKEEADKGIRMARVMHKGQHVANVITYRGRGGNWVSGAETPDGQNATKKYGIGLIDTKKEILKKIKQYHKENN